MTTPEKLRKRQLREGVVLIMLAIAVTLQAIYFNVQDTQQREDVRRSQQKQQACLVEKFRDLSKALDVRANLTERESNASRRIWLIYSQAAGLVKDDPTKPLKPADQHRLQRDLVKALLNYQSEIEDIQKTRRENPVPPYPIGTCGAK